MNNLIDLSDKHILIIGASSGIGKQTAITLSEIGARLTLVARREELLKEAVDCLEGKGHECYVADVSDVASIDTLIKGIVAKDGLLDGLVYAAGTGMALPLMQSKPDKVQAAFNVNFFGFFEVVRQVSRKGRFNPGMRIVGVSSCASLRGDKSKAIYSSSKAAMDSAVRSWQRNWRRKESALTRWLPL